MMLVVLRPAAHRRLKQQVLDASLSMNGSVSDAERLWHAGSKAERSPGSHSVVGQLCVLG